MDTGKKAIKTSIKGCLYFCKFSHITLYYLTFIGSEETLNQSINLHWFSIQLRSHFKSLLIIYKILHLFLTWLPLALRYYVATTMPPSLFLLFMFLVLFLLAWVMELFQSWLSNLEWILLKHPIVSRYLLFWSLWKLASFLLSSLPNKKISLTIALSILSLFSGLFLFSGTKTSALGGPQSPKDAMQKPYYCYYYKKQERIAIFIIIFLVSCLLY